MSDWKEFADRGMAAYQKYATAWMDHDEGEPPDRATMDEAIADLMTAFLELANDLSERFGEMEQPR